jgi:CheY-like chemotaxis protein
MEKKRILVVDDDRVSLAIARDMLSEEGFQVESADSALAANQYVYGPDPPDLILLDVVMPLLSGDRKIQFLKEREASRNIPVVLMSGKPRSELMKIARDSRADGFVTKPLERESLMAAIARHL